MIPQLPSANQHRWPRDGVRAAERAGIRYRSFAASAASPPLTPQTPSGCLPRQIVPFLSTISPSLPSGRMVPGAVVSTSVRIVESRGGREQRSRSTRMQVTPAHTARTTPPSPEATKYQHRRRQFNVIASPSDRALFSGRTTRVTRAARVTQRSSTKRLPPRVHPVVRPPGPKRVTARMQRWRSP